jgi:hypothetical protein
MCGGGVFLSLLNQPACVLGDAKQNDDHFKPDVLNLSENS